MTSDLAIEIKKLADKYRNNKKTGLLDSGDFGNELEVGEYDISNSNDDADDFDYRNLDSLEKEIDNFQDIEEGSANEIRISDFINPSISIVSSSEFENIHIDDEVGEIEKSDKRKIGESLKTISRNLRDLKALLRS